MTSTAEIRFLSENRWDQKMFPEGGKKAKENNNATFIFLSKMEGYIHCSGGFILKSVKILPEQKSALLNVCSAFLR